VSDVFAITQVGLSAGQERLLTLTTNAAAATLPGYKRQVAAQSSAFATHFDGLDTAARPAVPELLRGVDVRPSALISTGKPLDLAVEGPVGFFALSDGASAFLTRNGAFSVDAEGYLVGERGLRVQGAQGDLRIGAGEVSVRGNGEIVRRGDVLGTLQLFVPGVGAAVTPRGGALIGVDGSVQALDAGRARLSAGFLESSNAGGPQDMLALMSLTRQFESLVRVTQGYDEVLGRAIQKLGEI
jgi:flagellar basal body rod protein FlgG